MRGPGGCHWEKGADSVGLPLRNDSDTEAFWMTGVRTSLFFYVLAKDSVHKIIRLFKIAGDMAPQHQCRANQHITSTCVRSLSLERVCATACQGVRESDFSFAIACGLACQVGDEFRVSATEHWSTKRSLSGAYWDSDGYQVVKVLAAKKPDGSRKARVARPTHGAAASWRHRHCCQEVRASPSMQSGGCSRRRFRHPRPSSCC